MNKEPCPFDPPSEPLSSVLVRDIAESRVWQLERFLEAFEKGGDRLEKMTVKRMRQ